MERAAQGEAHVVGRTALGLEGVLDGPLERPAGGLLREVRGDHEMLRGGEERGKEEAFEFAFGLFAGELLSVRRTDATIGGGFFGGGLRREERFLGGALAPLFDDLRVAHHLNARAVGLFGHVRKARADHLADGRVEFVDVRGSQKDAGESAFGDAIEIALRRFAGDFLGGVVIGEMRGERMGGDVRFGRGGEPAGFALMELSVRRVGLGGDLEENGRGIVEEEEREILQFVGVGVLLELADDCAEGLCFGKDFDIDGERLHERPGRGTGGVAVRRTAAAKAGFAAAALRQAPAVRTALLRTTALGRGDARVFFGPIGGEPEGAQGTQIELRFFFRFHTLPLGVCNHLNYIINAGAGGEGRMNGRA